MTLLHMVNCCVTAFGPTAVLISTLSEGTNTLRLSAYGAAFYFANLVTKSLLLVVLPFPGVGGEGFRLTRELLTCVTNIVDFAGVTLLLKTRQATSFEVKARLLFVGLGWSLGDSIASNLLPFVIGARASEFRWEFIYRSILANFSMVCQIIFTALVFVSGRKGIDERSWLGILMCSAIHLVGIPLLTSYGKQPYLSADWVITTFAAQVAMLTVSAITIRRIFHSLAPSKND